MRRRELERIDADPTVRAAAEQLGIPGSRMLLSAICDATEHQVHKWIDELGESPATLDDVHRIVLNRSRVRIERIECDEDLKRVESKLKALSVPVQLQFEFARDTEAVVVRNDSADTRSSSQYLAVVDARGDRIHRAWFGERHEPSHIVSRDPSAKVLSRRTKVERPEPIEVVVDAVAARIGFWEPVVLPVFNNELSRQPTVLEALEATKGVLAPGASVEATYRALARFCPRPLVILRSGEGCRTADRDSDPAKSWALRAQTVIRNEMAPSVGMQVWRNYRIPTDSVIASAISRWPVVLSEEDNLGRWTSESGRSLASHPVRVTAKGSWATIESL